MNLIEEAVIIELLGIRMYAFGLYVMLGTVCAAVILGVAGGVLHLKKGTVPLTFLLSLVLGIVCSRLVFCLLNRELGRMTPFSVWFQTAGGGWSLFGMLGGAALAGWLSAQITKENTGSIMDVLSLAVLPVIAAERIGENRIEDFDISRPLDSTFLTGSFLAVGEDEPCLATYYVAAAAAVILFVYLAVRFSRRGPDGNVAILFLLLFGASAIITESLRYDRFLSISFVGMQQIFAALTLAAGVILAVRRSGKFRSALSVCAIASIPVMVGIVIGLEFALDRTTWNKLMLYFAMAVSVAVPAGLGMKLLKSGTKRNETA